MIIAILQDPTTKMLRTTTLWATKKSEVEASIVKFREEAAECGCIYVDCCHVWRRLASYDKDRKYQQGCLRLHKSMGSKWDNACAEVLMHGYQAKSQGTILEDLDGWDEIKDHWLDIAPPESLTGLILMAIYAMGLAWGSD